MDTPNRNDEQPRVGDALLIVDVQNDFLPGGSLAVPQGDQVVPALNRYLGVFELHNLPVYATRIWHPAGHCSFREQGGPWPPHCIAHTSGAEISAALHLSPITVVVSKATTVEQDAYSGFEGTDLDARLHAAGIKRLYIGGLATDYCVLNTVRDALKLGYRVFLLGDAIRAVDAKLGDGQRAVKEMFRLGAHQVKLEELAA